MEVIDDAPSVNTDRTTRPRAKPHMRRALEIRIAALEAEQQEAEYRHEALLYRAAKAILGQKQRPGRSGDPVSAVGPVPKQLSTLSPGSALLTKLRHLVVLPCGL
jgi:hypothetical protein